MASLTATADPTTGTILVQVEQTIMRDLFTRVVAGGWGSATTGQAWTNTGGAAGDYSVNGTQGVVSNGTLNVSRITTSDMAQPDQDFQITWITPAAVPTGTGPFAGSVITRYTDANNYYFAHVDVNVGGVVTLRLRKRVLGVNTNISDTFTLPVTHAGSNQYLIRMQACGNMLRAKAWVSTVTEPDWIVTASDFDLPAGNRAGQRSILDPGVTNALPVVWQFDNAFCGTGDGLRLYRVTPDGVEAEVFGSPFNTNSMTAAAATGTATLWDGAAPFDIDVFYRLYSACATLTQTSNTVNLDSDDTGWIRDPFDPTLNRRLEFDEFFDDCLDQDVIVFSGLGNPQYESASGVFDIVNARRPTTVAQTRKNYQSSLSLTSYSIDDIVDLEDLYDAGRPLLLSLPISQGWAMRTYGTDWITIFDIVQTHIGVDQGVTARGWEMPFRLSTEPPDPSENGTGGNGIGGGGATYDILAASALGVTYTNLSASGQTYDQVAAGVGY